MGDMAEQLAAKFGGTGAGNATGIGGDSTGSTADSQHSQLATFAGIIQDISGVDAEQVDRDTSLREGAGLTSLGLIETTIRTEQTFGVKLNDQTVDSFDTVGDVLEYLNQQKQA